MTLRTGILTTLLNKLEKLKECLMATTTASLAPFPTAAISTVKVTKKKKDVQTKEPDSKNI